MKRFFQGKRKPGGGKGANFAAIDNNNTNLASKFAANHQSIVAESLSDMDVYTTTGHPSLSPPSRSPQGQTAPMNYRTNNGVPHQIHSMTTGINASGKRVTTTTVRVPPPSAAAAAAPTGRPPQSPEPEENKINALTRELVKKFIADIWNRGEVDLIPSVCSPSLRFNGNTGFDRVGHDGLARMVGTIREALDDYHCEIHSMVVENNKAFCRLRFTGKHTGNLLGFAPTNKVVFWMGATEFTCQNGKILKVWELGDVKSLEEQLSGRAKNGEQKTD
jgi:predicted ester cyclase